MSSEIPYEAQCEANSCGAACLTMIYRSFGEDSDQKEIMPSVMKPSFSGSPRCWTHLLGRHALQRGYHALIVQSRDPWRSLQVSKLHSLRVIVHHRLAHQHRAGHYCVVVDIDETSVKLHDPQAGADLVHAWPTFRELWKPASVRSEVRGWILVAIQDRATDHSCGICARPVVEEVSCSSCNQVVALKPASLLGCLDEACSGRLWDSCFCPWCDGKLNLAGARSRESGVSPHVK